MKLCWRWVLLIALLLGSSTAFAHQVGLSTGEYDFKDDVLSFRLTFARSEIQTRSTTVAKDFLGLDVQSDKGTCPVEVDGTRLVENDGFEISGKATCPSGAQVAEINLGFLTRVEGGHRHYLTGTGLGSKIESIAYKSQPSFRLASGESDRWSALLGMLFLGFSHILSGPDHLLFLLGLLIPKSSLRNLLFVATSFTVAHSITLATAVLGVWAPSPSIVEPIIALSVAYVGLESFFVEAPRYRMVLTFVFGLVHGFGFAGALTQVAMPPGTAPWMLLCFNLGVELGQILVLSVMLAVLIPLRRNRQMWIRRSSLLIAAMGVFWFVQRAFLSGG